MPNRLRIPGSLLFASGFRLLALAALCSTFGCSDHHSPVKPGEETIATPATPTGIDSLFQGDNATYTTALATSSLGDSLEYRFQFALALDELTFTLSAWSRNPSLLHPWPTPGSYLVRVQARCATHQAVESSWSAGLPVNVTAEIVSTPTQPSGPTVGNDGEQQTFTTGGSVSSRGHAVEYRMKVIDPIRDAVVLASSWSATPSFNFTWQAADDYQIVAEARCATHISAVSDPSPPLAVTIQPPGPPIVTAASLGLTEAGMDQSPLTLHRVLGAWNEADLAWNSMPALSDSIGTNAYSVDCNFDITCITYTGFELDPALVQGWVDGTTTNYGLAITPGTTGADLSFLKRDVVTIYPARVDVTWHYQGESLTRYKSIVLSADTYTDESQPTVNFNSAAYLITGRAGGAEKRIFVKIDASLP